ncbi:MAG: aldose 1-epimerase [Phycisphaerae bacterium]|nr:aldose 1-epimerase [Phycisphaerae bacterium]
MRTLRTASVEERTDSGVRLVRLRVGDAHADIAPDLGAAIVSWSCLGRERLALPLPLAEFAKVAKTGGVPLLYPWANRLRRDTYEWNGTHGDVSSMPGLKRDGNGLPIHGSLLRFADWDIVSAEPGRRSAAFVAQLSWTEEHPAFSAFPFDHDLVVLYELGERSLDVDVLVAAQVDMPVAFGWHPYLAAPEGSARTLELPARERVALDASMLPVRTAHGLAVESAVATSRETIGGRDIDELYRVHAHATARVGDTALVLRGGYRFLQVYAPRGAAFACVEPMVAPAAALNDAADLPHVAAGDTFEASFSLLAEASRRGS